jgi:hypothetical protein
MRIVPLIYAGYVTKRADKLQPVLDEEALRQVGLIDGLTVGNESRLVVGGGIESAVYYKGILLTQLWERCAERVVYSLFSSDLNLMRIKGRNKSTAFSLRSLRVFTLRSLR